MAMTLIQQIEEVLDRKLEEVLDRKLEEVLDRKLEEVLDRKLDEKLDDKLGVFMEHMDDKFDTLAEVIEIMNERMMELPTRDEFNEVKADIVTIKLAVRDTNREMHGL
jgi:hypothetical protein